MIISHDLILKVITGQKKTSASPKLVQGIRLSDISPHVSKIKKKHGQSTNFRPISVMDCG